MRVEFREPRLADLAAIAADIRPEDAEEVRLSHGHTPMEALCASVARSKQCCAVFTSNDLPILVFGVGKASILATTGRPWLLGTRKMTDHRRRFAALSRGVIQDMRRGVSLLENWVWAGSLVSVRWIASCGFIIEPPEPHGPQGAPFHRFWMPGSP